MRGAAWRGRVTEPRLGGGLACAGWWGRSWPRNGSLGGGVPNGTAWQHAYTYGKYVMSRLEPDCDAGL